jgi:superoxide dismutase, Cu-Zn family
MRRIVAVCLIAGSLLAVAAQAQTPASPPASAEIKARGGVAAGTANFADGPKGVIMRIEVKGLTPGWHGLHFHEKGDCSEAAFKSAGGHVHGGSTLVHGLMNPEGNESGDLPNLYVAQDGTGHAEIFAPYVSLKTGTARTALLDQDGSAVVIHANPDDHSTQPIGGAGDRIACGVIR